MKGYLNLMSFTISLGDFLLFLCVFLVEYFNKRLAMGFERRSSIVAEADKHSRETYGSNSIT